MRKRHGPKTKAQTLTEYLLLICLLAVGSIPIVRILSNVIRDQVHVSAQRIGGQSAESKTSEHLEAAPNKIRRDLDDFWKR